MKNLILVSAMGLAMIAPLSTQDRPTTASSNLSDEATARFRALEAESQDAYRTWKADLREKIIAARESGEELPESAHKSPDGKFLKRFQMGAADYKGEESAVPFLLWIAQTGIKVDFEAGTMALETLMAEHSFSAALAPLTSLLEYLDQVFEPERAYELLGLLEENNQDPSIRGWSANLRLLHRLGAVELGSDAYGLLRGEIMASLEANGDARMKLSIVQKIEVREKFSIGATVPDIVGTDLDGVAFKLSDYKGKILFVDFWGDW